MKKRVQNRIKKWERKLNQRSLQTLIVLPFTLIGVSSILIMAVALYVRFTNTAKNMVMEKNIQILEQTNQALNSYLKQMMKISDTVYYQILKQRDTTKDSIREQFLLLYSGNQDKVINIALFDSSGKVVDAVPISSVKKNATPQNTEWFENAAQKIEELHFSTPYVQNIFNGVDTGYRWVVSLSRYVEFQREGDIEEGILLVDMNFSGIEQVLKTVSVGNEGYLYLMDQEGEIIYHPRQQLLYSGLEEEDNRETKNYEDGAYVKKFQDEQRMVTIKTVGYTGWKLVSVVPMKSVVTQYSDFRSYIFIFTLGLMFILIQVSSYVSKKITVPIEKLEKSVEEIENGNLDAEIIVSGSEEIRFLGNSIRSMITQLRNLMADIVTEQELKRKSELEALQTQINPHFLYNTLDSIVWMIENENYDGAVRMVTSLARLFRISISKGKNVISVREELAHAEYYMEIQKIRYKNKFTYSIETTDESKEYFTVKLILQPMIENAINHGMAYMDQDDEGHICVRAYQKGEELWLEVEDNGCGMPEEKVESLLKKTEQSKSKGSGIGMKNVHERIQIYFGKNYGVRIFSEPDEGTLIRIVLPLLRNQEE